MKKIVGIILSAVMLVSMIWINPVKAYAADRYVITSIDAATPPNASYEESVEEYRVRFLAHFSFIYTDGSGNTNHLILTNPDSLIWDETEGGWASELFTEGHVYSIKATLRLNDDRNFDFAEGLECSQNWTVSDIDGEYALVYLTHIINFDSDVEEISYFTHVHDWTEGVIYEATQNSDGLEGIYCKTCGAIKESHVISAYEYSVYNYALPKINAAKAGQTITFEFGEWNSFPKSFMEKLAEKSANGVTFVFKYKWNHKLQTITIPAGTPVDLNFEYYGPAKMAELYGMY